LDKSSKIEIKIINSNGDEIKSIINDYRQSGEYIISYNVNDLSQGLYYLQLITPIENVTETFIILK
jgi:hypothetical protein